ncbi:uncharacterized protein LOC110880400 [Helianthus annuus]|uniref:uncharacterized protein LOC110880400 n=1 Tax=Helianthus annuus TaxID=4232 RepID=UPI001652C981|nr:uncharacterized protein LOC110880400 [Helianthus annuus]
MKVSQGTISNTLKRSSDFLSTNFDKDGSYKHHKAAKYPDMEKVVYEWFLQHQERVNITGELTIEKAVEALKLLYPQDSSEHKLSQGWLDDDSVPLKLVTRKEALQATTTLHKFLLQYENAVPQLLSAMRRFKDKLNIDLKFTKKKKKKKNK